MPLSDAKKPIFPEIDPASIPGYTTPPAIAPQSGVVSVPAPPRAQAPPEHVAGYDLLPARIVWHDRFFDSDAVKGGEAIGAWLTEFERSGAGVLGVQAVYVPGGVVVLVKTREAVSGDT